MARGAVQRMAVRTYEQRARSAGIAAGATALMAVAMGLAWWFGYEVGEEGDGALHMGVMALIGAVIAGGFVVRNLIRRARPDASPTLVELARFGDNPDARFDMDTDLAYGEYVLGFTFAQRWMVIHGTHPRVLRYDEIREVRAGSSSGSGGERLLVAVLTDGDINPEHSTTFTVYWADGLRETRKIRTVKAVNLIRRLQDHTADNHPPVTWKLPEELEHWLLQQPAPADDEDPQ